MKIKWSEKVTNEELLERIREEREFLNNILPRIANWIGHILRRNCLLHDTIKEQMTEVKGVGRRRIQLLDYLRNRRRYWELIIEIDGNDSLPIEHEEEMQIIFHKQHT